MSIKIIEGDLFDTTAPFICHQVNCKGKMGSGVAKQVRSLYPKAYEMYMKACKEYNGDLLGRVQICCVKDKHIVNMFAQDRYGYDGKQYTNYTAFEYCLNKLKTRVQPGETIAMPYKIGCGLAGGDWNVVYQLIDKILGQQYTVELWRKDT